MSVVPPLLKLVTLPPVRPFDENKQVRLGFCPAMLPFGDGGWRCGGETEAETGGCRDCEWPQGTRHMPAGNCFAHLVRPGRNDQRGNGRVCRPGRQRRRRYLRLPRAAGAQRTRDSLLCERGNRAVAHIVARRFYPHLAGDTEIGALPARDGARSCSLRCLPALVQRRIRVICAELCQRTIR